jgi:hypothetical protein
MTYSKPLFTVFAQAMESIELLFDGPMLDNIGLFCGTPDAVED